MPNPVVVARGRLGIAVRNGGDVVAARLALKEAKLERVIREAVAAAPPLSADQRDRLAALLLAGGA